MPSAYTSSQKAAISQFVNFTSTKDSLAAKQLKAHNWNLQQAIDADQMLGNWGLYAFLRRIGAWFFSKIDYFNQLTMLPISPPPSSPPSPLQSPPMRPPTRPPAIKRRNRTKSMEKRLGKSMRKLFEQMGAFEYEDEEKIAEELLAMGDPQRPFSYGPLPDEGDFEPDLSTLFDRWSDSVQRPSWMLPENISQMYKFALRRPLMPERVLVRQLRKINKHVANLYTGFNRSSSRSSSRETQDQQPCGSPSRRPHSNSDTHFNHEDERDAEAQELRVRLWGVYDDVEDDVIKLQDAPSAYNIIRLEEAPKRYAIHRAEDQVIDNNDLAQYLTSWGIPACHIPLEDQEPFLCSADDIPSREDADESYPTIEVEERFVIRSIAEYIRLFRTGALGLSKEQIVSMILDSFKIRRLDSHDVQLYVEEGQLSPTFIAMDLWYQNAFPLNDTSSSSSNSSGSPIGNSPVQKHRPISNSPIGNGRSSSARVDKVEETTTKSRRKVSFGDESNRAVHFPPGSENKKPMVDEDNYTERRGRTRAREPVADGKAPASPYPRKSPLPRSPFPMPASSSDKAQEPSPESTSSSGADGSENWQQFGGFAGYPDDRSYDKRRLSQSPPGGMTRDLFGLPMHTKQARVFAERLNLPRGYIQDRIRSITPRRQQARKLNKETQHLAKSMSERKPSADLSPNSPKIARNQSHSDLFATQVEGGYAVFDGSLQRKVPERYNPLRGGFPETNRIPFESGDSSTDTTSEQENQDSTSSGRDLGTYQSKCISNRSRRSALAYGDRKPSVASISIIEFLSDLIQCADLPSLLKHMERFPYMFTNIFREADWMLLHVSAAVERGFVEIYSARDEQILASLDRLIKREQSRESRIHRSPNCESQFEALDLEDKSLRVPMVPIAEGQLSDKLPSRGVTPLKSSTTGARRAVRFADNLDSKRKAKAKVPKRDPSPIVPGAASEEWATMSERDAIEFALDDALNDRKHFPFYMQCRREVRSQIKSARARANQKMLENSHFSGANATPTSSSSTSSLNKLFDKYRDNANEEPDRIGVEGSMRYLQDIGVKLDEPVLLVILSELNAPTMGEFSRDGFVDGWSSMRGDSISKQQAQIPSLRRSLPTNPTLFKKTYKATFPLARAAGQKIIPLETAIEYWRLLLTPPSLDWSTSDTPWLTWWIEFLETKWKKSVNKDMWDQLGIFVQKCGEDESMSWWSEDGAWPGVIDEFVAYVKDKRGNDGDPEDKGEEMDVG